MVLHRLNPCCSGRWSSTYQVSSWHCQEVVLILVVVDDGLVPTFWLLHEEGTGVLILVVVDDGLVLGHNAGGWYPMFLS